MKKMIYIRKSILFLAACFTLASCGDDFLDVNDNPNDPASSTPSLTLPVAQQQLAQLNGTTMMYLGNIMAYNYAVPSNWSALTDELRYNINRSSYTSIFENSYADIFKNLTYIENTKDPSGNIDYSAYYAISQTLKGFQYQYLVDLYGDVPFTEANQRGNNTTPVYDDAETVYKSVIDSLTKYAQVSLNLPDNAQIPNSSDIIFAGDMEKWAKFANTIKLRMLIRISGTNQDAYIQSQIASINANGAGFIEEDVTANPGYSKNADQQTPVWDYLGFDATGVKRDRNNYTVGTDFTIEYLKTTNDPRLTSIYAESVDNENYLGVYQSVDLPATGFTTSDLSTVGPGILKSAEQDQPILLLAESLLLQSEATVKGFLPGGDAAAKELYNQSIAASFTYLGTQVLEDEDNDPSTPDVLVAADPAVYYSQALPKVSWDSSTDKISAIITQKWIALNGISIEPWIEFTRTGYPTGLPISESSTRANRPVRLLYPSSEYSRNSKNVPASSPDDVFNKDPFWKQ